MKETSMITKYWPIIVSILVLAVTWGTLWTTVANGQMRAVETEKKVQALEEKVNGAILKSAEDYGEIKGDIREIKAYFGIKNQVKPTVVE